jgi:hypothetical protein
MNDESQHGKAGDDAKPNKERVVLETKHDPLQIQCIRLLLILCNPCPSLLNSLIFAHTLMSYFRT